MRRNWVPLHHPGQGDHASLELIGVAWAGVFAIIGGHTLVKASILLLEM